MKDTFSVVFFYQIQLSHDVIQDRAVLYVWSKSIARVLYFIKVAGGLHPTVAAAIINLSTTDLPADTKTSLRYPHDVSRLVCKVSREHLK